MPQKRYRPEEIIAKLRDGLLDGELFDTLTEAQILLADWRRLYNGLRPHRSLGGRPPAPGTLAWPGFSLSDYAPPALTPQTALALSQAVDQRMGAGHGQPTRCRRAVIN